MATGIDTSAPAPLNAHLGELRKRLLISLGALVFGAGIALMFAKSIYAWLARPLMNALPAGSSVIALSPLEGWLVYFKVSLIASVFATSPVWLYQAWAFAAPGLYRRERRLIALTAFASALLFTGGALAGYYLVMPHGLSYFIEIMRGTGIAVMPQMSLYLSFVIRMLIAFGVAFELPVIVVAAAALGLAAPARMARARPFVAIGAFVVAAIITPPDIFTQITLAIPFIALFEISLLAARLFVTRNT